MNQQVRAENRNLKTPWLVLLPSHDRSQDVLDGGILKVCPVLDKVSHKKTKTTYLGVIGIESQNIEDQSFLVEVQLKEEFLIGEGVNNKGSRFPQVVPTFANYLISE